MNAESAWDAFAPLDVSADSTGSVGPVGFRETPLDDVRAWFARFVCTMEDLDLDLLVLWTAGTHLAKETYTTARLVVDSPVHGAGKTTVLEHLARLCLRPVQMASISSPAMLARLVEHELRTLLIDEVDRALDPKRDGVGDLLAVLNSGYKRGATRPVLVPVKGGGWDVREMSTFAPVAMAGNSPNLPEDTRSRTIRVLLLPDLAGRVQPSDWEEIEPHAVALAERLAMWADLVRDDVRTSRPELPEGCIGRHKERWAPIKRVAVAAGGRWPQVADGLIVRDLLTAQLDKEDGMATMPPAVLLLRDLADVWGEEPFIATTDLLTQLIARAPDRWGVASPYGRAITPQRLGRMLARGFNVHSSRQGDSARGYYRQALAPAWRQMGIPTMKPTEPPTTAEPTAKEAGLCTRCDGATAFLGGLCEGCIADLDRLEAAL